MTNELLRYEKLAGDLEGMIASGVLRHGDRLPSLRRLAGERRLSVSTVVQALRQLEDRGLVEARPQSGYFVRRALPPRAEPVSRSTPEAAVPVDVT
ncbi:MAG: winged helix-turn-helix domain-containing protein, partial [Azonexus sp.]